MSTHIFPIKVNIQEGMELINEKLYPDARFTAIKETKTDSLWLICIRGESIAGKAVSMEEMDAQDGWMCNDVSSWADKREYYFLNGEGPYEADDVGYMLFGICGLTDEDGEDVNIRIEKMSKEEFMRASGRWLKAFDKLRKNPKQLDRTPKGFANA